MAKKVQKTIGQYSFSELHKTLVDINPNSKIIYDSPFSNINEHFGTGNYALNAHISGSLFGGIPAGRVILIAGDPGCIHPKQKIKVFISNKKEEKKCIET